MSNIVEWYKDLMNNKQGNCANDSHTFQKNYIIFIVICLYYFFRSANSGMVLGIWSRSNLDDYSDIYIFLRICWAEIHEGQKAIRLENHFDSLQLHSGAVKYLPVS